MHACVCLQVAADAKFVDLGADSLDTVEIMMALEEQFEITLDEEGAEKIATVQEAADLIAAQPSRPHTVIKNARGLCNSIYSVNGRS
eukprot:8831960-Pyramimonas_sp.AAC.1